MADRLNLTDLEAHARDETAARSAGDLSAAATSAFHRRYVPPLAVVTLPSRWSILVADDFEIDQDGELELSVDAALEVLASVIGTPGAVAAVTSVGATAPLSSTGGTAPVLSLLDDGVTFQKLQNIASDRLLGRDTAGSGDPEELAVSGGLEFTGAGGIQTAAFTGDVTKAAGGTAQTIANDAVTYAKIQNISAASRLLGRGAAGGAGDTEEIGLGAGLTMTGTSLSAGGGGDSLTVNGAALVDADLDDATPAPPAGRQNVTWQKDGGSPANVSASVKEAWPVGAIFMAVVSTNPNTLLGYGTWAAIAAGRVLVGLDSADVDFDSAEETGGAKTVAAVGSNAAEAAHTHSVTSNVTIPDHDDHAHTGPLSHGTHTHTYTEVPNHTHKLSTILRTATTGADNTNVAQTVDASSTKDTALATDNPTGGVATGTTAASVALTHGSTGLSTAALDHSPVNNAVTSGAGSSHNHAFTGSATSVVQPYFVCYMWKRTA